ncbi:tetratricopeptide repeat protein [Anaerolinea sp.]|uniref:tetratricopeptide repeat protein n=1 Tax=Anaerolinea sp. TaxID=1872519 RepID=UPI002ACE1846|nr:tetratricopeptide repeat protein [Anaerolinea sp.]
MNMISFIEELKGLVPSEDVPWILQSIRQDERIEQFITTSGGFSRVKRFLGPDPVNWSPGQIALLSLCDDDFSGECSANFYDELIASLEKQASDFLEEVLHQRKKVVSLGESALLGIALRNLAHREGWQTAFEKITHKDRRDTYSLWKTAILVSGDLQEEPLEWAKHLFTEFYEPLIWEWGIHWLSSRFLPLDKKIEITVELLVKAVPLVQIEVLQRLMARGCRQWSQKVAETLLDNHPLLNSYRKKVDLDRLNASEILQHALSLHQLATLYSIAGKTTFSESVYRAALYAVQHWQTETTLHQVVINRKILDLPQLKSLVRKIWSNPSPSKKLRWNLDGALMAHSEAERLQAIDTLENFEDPVFLLLKAKEQLSQGNHAVTLELGKLAVEKFDELFETEPDTSLFQSLSENWQAFIDDLLLLGLTSEALHCTQKILTLRPNDSRLLQIHSEIALRLMDEEQAYQTAKIAFAISPNDTDLCRYLASVCEKTHRWQEAQALWKTLLFSLPTKHQDVSLHLSYIRSSFYAGEDETVIQNCQKLLEQHSDCSEAYGWLGKAFLRTGNEQEGIASLTRATLLSPEDERWWLAISEYWLSKKDVQSALNTLKSAAMAVPESGSIYFHLGNLLLQQNQVSEALIYLRKASSLYPDNPEIVLRLCQALHGLGFLEEARRVLVNLKGKWNAYPEMAYEYSKIAVKQNDYEEALEALEFAVRGEHPQTDWVYEYARLVLKYPSPSNGLKNLHLEQAEGLLREILSRNPGDEQGLLLLAEVLVQVRKPEEAFRVFSQLAENEGFMSGLSGWKVLHGLGVTSMEMGDRDAALVFLKDAISHQPDNPSLLRDYAEACVKARFDQEALNVGELVCRLTPNDVDTGEWFANLAIRLEKPVLAIEKYLHLTTLAPHRLDLKLSLASLQLKVGAVEQAAIVLDEVLQTGTVDAEILRQAGYLYLSMEKVSEAVQAFEKALAVSLQPCPILLKDLMRVYEQTGRIEDAVKSGEMAIRLCHDDPELHLEFARLLSRIGRDTHAQSILLQALSLEHVENPLLRSEIHKELAYLAWKQEDFLNGLMYAEMGLLENPQSVSLRYLQGLFTLSLAQWEKSQRLLQTVVLDEKLLTEKDGVRLALLKGHVLLNNSPAEAEEVLHFLAEHGEASAEYLLLKSRWLATTGYYVEAKNILTSLPSDIEQDWVLWKICAERESLCFSSALHHIREFLQSHSGNPWAMLEYVKCVTIGKEISQMSRLLKIKPGGEMSPFVDELDWEKAEQVLQKLSGMVSADELRDWSIRLKVAFDPTAEHLKMLAGAVRSADEAACLIQGLQMVGNLQMALQIAHPYGRNEKVRFQQALCYLEKDSEKGLEIVRQLLAEHPQHPLYQTLFAFLAKDAGEKDSAYQAILLALAQFPEEPEWQAVAAELAVELGDVEQGILYWEKAVSLRPERTDYLIELGWTYMMVEAYEKAAEILSRAVKMESSNSSVWFNLAQVYKHLSRVEDAISCALRASEVDITHVQGFILASELALENKDYEQAKKYTEMALERDELNPKAIMAMIRVYNHLNKDDQSLSMLETLHGKLPPILELDLEKASLIYRLRGAQAALSVTQRLVTDFPEDANALALHAQVLADLGDVKSAERFAFRSLRQEPNQPDLALSLAKMQRNNGQLDQAVHLLTQAIALDPQNIELYIELGQVYSERREYDLALQTFHHAIRIAPHDPRGYYYTALILRDGKDFSGAERMLQHAAKLAPDDVVIHRQLVSVMALNLIHKSQEAGASL